MSYKQASKTEWQNDATKNGQWPGLEVINTGAFQRIADALEQIAPRYISLLRDVESMRERCDRYQQVSERLNRRIAGLKGAINRLKKAAGKGGRAKR